MRFVSISKTLVVVASGLVHTKGAAIIDPDPETCVTKGCCEEDCCSPGTKWDRDVPGCVYALYAPGHISGTYEDPLFEPMPCGVRVCCEADCCIQGGTVYDDNIQCCVPGAPPCTCSPLFFGGQFQTDRRIDPPLTVMLNGEVTVNQATGDYDGDVTATLPTYPPAFIGIPFESLVSFSADGLGLGPGVFLDVPDYQGEGWTIVGLDGANDIDAIVNFSPEPIIGLLDQYEVDLPNLSGLLTPPSVSETSLALAVLYAIANTPEMRDNIACAIQIGGGSLISARRLSSGGGLDGINHSIAPSDGKEHEGSNEVATGERVTQTSRRLGAPQAWLCKIGAILFVIGVRIAETPPFLGGLGGLVLNQATADLLGISLNQLAVFLGVYPSDTTAIWYWYVNNIWRVVPFGP